MLNSAKITCACLSMCAALAAPLTYAANFPSRAELHYVGPYGVPAVMTFARSGNRYNVVANINVPLYQMRFSSSGGVSGNTLKPSVYNDTRHGKSYAQARFSGNTVRYGKSGNAVKTTTVNGPVFDLFTLAWQLAMNNAQLPANVRITNGKKIYTVGGMRKTGSSRYALGNGSISVNNYRIKRGDDTIDYAFAPSLSNIPAQITYISGGESYTLKLKSVKLDGKTFATK